MRHRLSPWRAPVRPNSCHPARSPDRVRLRSQRLLCLSRLEYGSGVSRTFSRPNACGDRGSLPARPRVLFGACRFVSVSLLLPAWVAACTSRWAVRDRRVGEVEQVVENRRSARGASAVWPGEAEWPGSFLGSTPDALNEVMRRVGLDPDGDQDLDSTAAALVLAERLTGVQVSAQLL
ncbi:DUF6461 domain-containing protein [Streptomyces melanogenes]|uniref:DUF6461 domain-containing protein n=1 Tax=Streptomyces melanogenes TaxID=67326 RepID=UPI0037A4B210